MLVCLSQRTVLFFVQRMFFGQVPPIHSLCMSGSLNQAACLLPVGTRAAMWRRIKNAPGCFCRVVVACRRHFSVCGRCKSCYMVLEAGEAAGAFDGGAGGHVWKQGLCILAHHAGLGSRGTVWLIPG